MAQGERATERNGERNCPEHISTDLHFICRFFPLYQFFHLLFLLNQQLHNCDVMTEAGMVKSQTGQDETLLRTDRKKKKIKKRDSVRQTGGWRRRRGRYSSLKCNKSFIPFFFCQRNKMCPYTICVLCVLLSI